MNPEEKTILLGALFHDIGKFGHCCLKSTLKSHTEIGFELLQNLKESILPLLDSSELAFNELCDLVVDHHNHKNQLYLADKISSGSGIDDELLTEKTFSAKQSLLSSVFSSVRLTSQKDVTPHFYNQIPMDNKPDESLSPVVKDISKIIQYNQDTYDRFQKDLKIILSTTASTIDFPSVFALILNLFENYLWCLPNYTDGELQDVSLYNHLRDTAGFAHAIHRTKERSGGKNELVLIVGDLPGIQKYIFNVLNKKPAKILRGRSIFVQVITRVFAGIFLKNFNLTEASMIMNAGGKFYILVPGTKDFEEVYKKTIEEIDNLLSANFFYDLNFASGYTIFDFQRLADGEFGFGKVIDDASYHLLNGRNRMFESEFFTDFKQNKFVLEAEYIVPEKAEEGTDSVKCEVTNKPIRNGRRGKIQDEDDSYRVDLQVQNEFKIGNIIPKKPLVCSIKKRGSNFTLNEAVELDIFNDEDSAYKVIINPSTGKIIELLKKFSPDEIIRLFDKTSYIGVANYASMSEKSGAHKSVMSFEEMVDTCEGAHLLTLIKGDVDNLGLIMSAGLDQVNPVSRTTTMSNQLKYFFSTNLNTLLDDKCGSGDKRAYTVYAGGDDLLLVTTQSYSLDLLKEINDKFNQFVCHNPEIHISYSMTNFNHSTPIMLVAGFGEESQNRIKKVFKNPNLSNYIDENSFLKSNDKSGVMIFDTAVKNSDLAFVIEHETKLKKWVEDDHLSMGSLRYLFSLAQILTELDRNDFRHLMWHPRLNYHITKNIKKKGLYPNSEMESFYTKILSLSNNSIEQSKLKRLLMPIVSRTIYSLRKSKENENETE